MEETILLCDGLIHCNTWIHMAIVALILGLPPLPFVLAILLGPTPAEQERQRQALAAACYHCRHTRTPCAHRAAKQEEDPLC